MTVPFVEVDVFHVASATVLGVNIGVATQLFIDLSNFTATEGTPMGANRGIIKVEDSRFSAGGTLNNTSGAEIELFSGTLAVDGFDLTVKGGGQVILLNPDSSIFLAAGRTLSNVDNSIDGDLDGGGVISGAGTLVNQSSGIINADVGSAQLVLDIATRNQGMIEATNAGNLLIDGSVINNTGGGVLRAEDSSATVVVQPSGTHNTVTLKGSGTVGLNGDQITGGGSAVTLDNVNNTIVGGGKIGGAGLKLKNGIGGTINAFDTLIIDTGANTITSAGALNAEATTLVIASNLSNTGKLNADLEPRHRPHLRWAQQGS
jgi:hypothetical protein